MILSLRKVITFARLLMYTFTFLSVSISSSLISQTNSDRKELDQILRTELGVTDQKIKTPEPPKEDTLKKQVEENLIQERYAEKSNDSPSATWILLKILFVLVILVGTGYFLVQKMQQTKAAKYPVKGFMKVLSTLSLTPTQSLQIVEIGGRFLVLGVAEGAVNLVTEINSQDEKSQLTKIRDEADPYAPNFLESMLESLYTKVESKKLRMNKHFLESTDNEIRAEIQRKSKESLDRLRKHRELLEGGQS